MLISVRGPARPRELGQRRRRPGAGGELAGGVGRVVGAADVVQLGRGGEVPLLAGGVPGDEAARGVAGEARPVGGAGGCAGRAVSEVAGLGGPGVARGLGAAGAGGEDPARRRPARSRCSGPGRRRSARRRHHRPGSGRRRRQRRDPGRRRRGRTRPSRGRGALRERRYRRATTTWGRGYTGRGRDEGPTGCGFVILSVPSTLLANAEAAPSPRIAHGMGIATAGGAPSSAALLIVPLLPLSPQGGEGLEAMDRSPIVSGPTTHSGYIGIPGSILLIAPLTPPSPRCGERERLPGGAYTLGDVIPHPVGYGARG